MSQHYIYGANSPPNMVDPSGNQPKKPKKPTNKDLDALSKQIAEFKRQGGMDAKNKELLKAVALAAEIFAIDLHFLKDRKGTVDVEYDPSLQHPAKESLGRIVFGPEALDAGPGLFGSTLYHEYIHVMQFRGVARIAHEVKNPNFKSAEETPKEPEWIRRSSPTRANYIVLGVGLDRPGSKKEKMKTAQMALQELEAYDAELRYAGIFGLDEKAKAETVLKRGREAFKLRMVAPKTFLLYLGERAISPFSHLYPSYAIHKDEAVK